MTAGFFLFGGFLLAWAFGRNNFSNIFGSAVGTGILSLKLAAFLTAVFLLLGAYLNSSGTSGTMAELSHFNTFSAAFSFSMIVAIMMIFLTRFGIPASVAQISIGALVGWNLAFQESVAWKKVMSVAFGWFYSPVISCVIAFFIFKMVRFYLNKHPLPVLYQDVVVRILWMVVGSFTAYSLGANNMPVLIIPYAQVLGDTTSLSLLFSTVVEIGCLMASRRVIRMVSSKLFPLSSVESLIVGFSGALTLILFSFQNGLFPPLPISASAALIGAIVGVSFTKGGYGLKGKSLLSVIFSWFWAPLFSCLLCFSFAIIMGLGRF
ncbi:MAG: inorganic phosphate transporter [Alphaproteobacteria bacterium]|nr:inorganic phosphate transporter [Alphaproteobacteria bacterium]